MRASDLFGDGFALANLSLSHEQCDYLASAIPAAGGGRGGVRGLIQHPAVVQLLLHPQFGQYVWSVAGRDLVAVKATLFDKTANSNWRSQWHQDRVIAIRERMQVAGYGPWSMKAGVPHAEAPVAVLEQMLALRFYLDDSGAGNGPLRVIPGSHASGKVPDEELADLAGETAVEVLVPKGGILAMRPLLVHASSASHEPGHRRVLHVELAPPEAISPLQWHSMLPLRRAA